MENMDALMNPKVLQTLFQQPTLDFADLKNARLVCKEWYFQSLARWRKTAVITVRTVDECWMPLNLSFASESECRAQEKGQNDVVDEEGQNGVDEQEDEHVDNEEDQWAVDDLDNSNWEKDVDEKAKKSYPSVLEYLRFLDADINLLSRSDSDDKPVPLENKLAAYPYLRLKMLDWNDMTQAMEDFWTRIGEHLEYLHLENCQVVNFLHTWQSAKFGVINMTANQLPKLTTLIISASDTRYNLNDTVWMVDNLRGVPMIPHHNLKVFHTSGCKVKWSLLFTCFPNLQVIRNSDKEDYVCSHESNVFRELMIQPREIQKTLKSLDLIHSRECMITWPVLVSMGTLRLDNLTYLSIVLENSISEKGAHNGFKHFFQRNGNLKVWKVLRECSAGPSFRDFPDGIQMTSLKELHLYGNVTRSMQFIRFTPNLERLVIYFTCDGKQSVDGDLVWNAIRACGEGSIKPLEKMENLCLDVELSVKRLGVLGKWMPKLKGLRTVLNNLSFKKVCSQWGTGLEELVCLKGSTVNEGTLVGFKPNVISLIDLRRFGIEEEKNVNISDEVVVDGFLKMGRLEVVQLPVKAESQLSSEAVERLKQKITRLEII